MYNGYFNSPYQNPYQNTYPYQQQNNGNVLPPQQVLQAAGKTSIDALQMSPNSSVIIMDTTAPMVWLCVSDGLGKVTATGYDITIHKDKPVPDVGSLEERVAKIEAFLEGITHDKSNDGSAQPKHATAKADV